MMFTKKEKVRKVAEVVVGFGILFVGLSTMSQAMANMKNEPQVVNLLMSLKNPFLATLMGFALTAIIQSSSVTVSIVLLLANQDLLPLPITLYIILGCNIGACATAMLASMTGKKDAKRAALIHLLFNIIGTVIIYIALFVAGDQIVELIKSISADNGRFVANAHTLIKIAQVIMLFPFTGWLVKMTYLIVPGEDQKVGYRESYQLKYIGDRGHRGSLRGREKYQFPEPCHHGLSGKDQPDHAAHRRLKQSGCPVPCGERYRAYR